MLTSLATDCRVAVGQSHSKYIVSFFRCTRVETSFTTRGSWSTFCKISSPCASSGSGVVKIQCSGFMLTCSMLKCSSCPGIYRKTSRLDRCIYFYKPIWSPPLMKSFLVCIERPPPSYLRLMKKAGHICHPEGTRMHSETAWSLT